MKQINFPLLEGCDDCKNFETSGTDEYCKLGLNMKTFICYNFEKKGEENE